MKALNKNDRYDTTTYNQQEFLAVTKS